ncbi:MAG: hypothetical protein QNL62_17725 [Gammaproteobacteria bacterium]|nr:hypothetical protein [Gammaproteobacteria bacterium]
MQTNRLTFIVPGLLDPVPYLDQLPVQELPELAIFSTLLSRGKHSIPESPDYDYNNYYTCLLKEFALHDLPGSDKSSSNPLSVASICYFYDSVNLPESENINSNPDFITQLKNKWIMRVDPCFMAPDRDQLVLAEIQNLDISMAEARQLVAEINDFFQDYAEETFWTLQAVTPERWYIVSDKPIHIQTVPPENVVGQSVKRFLFTADKLAGGDSRHWLHLFNEFQMILHQSPLNRQRTEQGKLPVNSLWFWGAGEAIDFSALSKGSRQTANVYADNVFAKGLARLKNYRNMKVPDRYQPVSANNDQQSMYIISDFFHAIQNKDIFSWVGLLTQFESHFLMPLVADIKSGRIAEVNFISPSGKRLLLTRRLLNRWWRKKIPFQHFLSNKI